MATEVSISISLHCQPFLHHHHHHHSAAINHHPFLSFPKRRRCSFSLSATDSSSPPPLQNPLRNGRFLTNKELENLNLLENYSYHHQLETGLLWVRLMRDEETDMTVTLLSQSFAESMMMGTRYVKLLEFLVKNYLIERRELMPHNATLIGVYRENGEEDFELAGTVELTFNQIGANPNPPTPNSPKGLPYICNMAVSKPLRRRGIGWHLLKAGEELITKMGSSREVYLHCRMIDEAPFNMYTRAGYNVVKTDSILTLLTLQRRKHLMHKQLPLSDDVSQVLDDIPNEHLN